MIFKSPKDFGSTFLKGGKGGKGGKGCFGSYFVHYYVRNLS
jgi:hypothetical protein